MEYDMNPFRDLPIRISPVEFEQFCMETLRAYAAKESLQDFEIKHNQKVETPDSTYQIDVLAEYTALGCILRRPAASDAELNGRDAVCQRPAGLRY